MLLTTDRSNGIQIDHSIKITNYNRRTISKEFQQAPQKNMKSGKEDSLEVD
jgi:hypothetical protein